MSSLHLYTFVVSWAFVAGSGWPGGGGGGAMTPPGRLVSPLVGGGPWMSTVVLYCWCHSDGASVLLYFTLQTVLTSFDIYFMNILQILFRGSITTTTQFEIVFQK